MHKYGNIKNILHRPQYHKTEINKENINNGPELKGN